MEFALTKRYVARGARPDAEMNNRMYLIKNVSLTRATYQVRLLLYRATQEGTKLSLDVPKACILSSPLKALIKENRRYIEVVKS